MNRAGPVLWMRAGRGGGTRPRHIDDERLWGGPLPLATDHLDPASLYLRLRDDAEVKAVCGTIAATSGASSFRGAGKTSTLATAVGSPATGISFRGNITKTIAIARIAALVATPLIGPLRPTGQAAAPPEAKPSGSSSSSHTLSPRPSV